jgi:hypothetical protein
MHLLGNLNVISLPADRGRVGRIQQCVCSPVDVRDHPL